MRVRKMKMMMLCVAASAAVVTGADVCDYTPKPYVDACYDSHAEENPCGGCNSVVETGKLQYDGYNTESYMPLSSEEVCEEAIEWICPESDGGLCCVQQAEFSTAEPYRKLCANTQTTLPNAVSRDEIDLWIQGAAMTLDQSFAYGSQMSMEVSWSGEPWSVAFADSTGNPVFTLELAVEHNEATAVLLTSEGYASVRGLDLHERQWISIHVEQSTFDV